MTTNQELISKAIIRKRFGFSALHYDQAATPQKQIAEQLITFIPEEEQIPEKGDVLEIGCGTGFLSSLLIERFDDSKRHFYLNDLSPEVEHTLRSKVGVKPTFSAGDAEQVEWEKSLALVASSSCIQWWHAPLSFVAKSSLSLRSGGVLLYSTFLPDNLTELRAVTGKGLNYPTETEHRIALEAVGFKEIKMHHTHITVTFEGILPLLKHLKLTGTNGLRGDNQGLWSQERMERMEKDYRQVNGLSQDDHLPLTYSALLVCAKKK